MRRTLQPTALTLPSSIEADPEESYFGYGYQTWIFPGERRLFALLGVHGQAIFVDPSSRLVMVHTAVRKEPAGSLAEAIALWHGVVKALGASQ